MYLDNNIVYSNTFDEHIERLDRVFTRLLEQGLNLKPEKCKFLQYKVTYVGHQISSDSIMTNPETTRLYQSGNQQLSKNSDRFLDSGVIIEDLSKTLQELLDHYSN